MSTPKLPPEARIIDAVRKIMHDCSEDVSSIEVILVRKDGSSTVYTQGGPACPSVKE